MNITSDTKNTINIVSTILTNQSASFQNNLIIANENSADKAIKK